MSVTARVPWIDWARSFALLNMVAFHFLFDLRMLGIPPGWMTYGDGFTMWARAIAGSFLFLAGLSLWLSHGAGIRWAGFGRRLGILVLAAAAVSVATYFAVPNGWVRFGILHSIALSSVIGLAFLRLPAGLTALIAGVILWVGPDLAFPALNGEWLLWLGLGTEGPFMMDYEPIIPWVAPLLLGVAFGRMGRRFGWWTRPDHPQGRPTWWARAAAWPGQHSLMIYLIHQPILMGGLMAWIWLTG